MANKHLSNEIRQKIIKAVFQKGKSIREAADDLDVNYKTAAKICRTFRLEDRTDKKRGIKPLTYNSDYLRHIEAFFQSNVVGTLNDCRKYLQEQGVVKLPSLSTIHRLSCKARLSYKDLSIIPAQRNTPETIRLRKHYAARYLRLEGTSNFVFIDEFGCNLSLRRRKGRSRVGTPATLTTSFRRGNNLSVCAAIDINGPIVHVAKFHAFNQEEFIEFLKQLKEKLDMTMTNVLIFDNVSFHKTASVKGFMRENNLKYTYLPPYSPMFNPIEECFSKVKGQIRRILNDGGADLFAAVEQAFASVTPSNCRGWFNHTKQFFPQAINSRPITCVPEPVETSDDSEGESSNDEIVDELEVSVDPQLAN